MDLIYSLFSFYFICQMIDAKNCQFENNIHLFGQRCDLMCHCKNNEECDVISGDCNSGCDIGWFGPGCQYRDLAANGRAQQLDVSQHEREDNAKLAIDGDLTTCSETKQSTYKPFWTISFPVSETITEIHIVTKPDKINLFKNFLVIVKDKEDACHKCYRHGNEAPKSEEIVVLCNNHLLGNQVTIQLDTSNKTLVLCDVKINGGRNLALKREASQISVYTPCAPTCSAERAVDGHDSISWWTKCSYTRYEQSPWWEVDLGYKARIRKIRIVTRDDETKYAIEVSNITHTIQVLDDVLSNVGVNVIGRFIKVTRREMNKLIILCEIYVYGDCIEDMCGYDCTKPCHCQKATILDKISGNCSNGCKDGWSASQCEITHIEKDENTSCKRGMYGINCSNRCNENCNGDQSGVCNDENGKCFGGCKAGWKGEICDQTCTAGSYGINCEEICSKKCKGKDLDCNHTTGHCLKGCKRGWTGDRCDKACDTGGQCGFDGHGDDDDGGGHEGEIRTKQQQSGKLKVPFVTLGESNESPNSDVKFSGIHQFKLFGGKEFES